MRFNRIAHGYNVYIHTHTHTRCTGEDTRELNDTTNRDEIARFIIDYYPCSHVRAADSAGGEKDTGDFFRRISRRVYYCTSDNFFSFSVRPQTIVRVIRVGSRKKK